MIGTLNYYVLAEAVTCFFSFLLLINIVVTLNVTELRQLILFIAAITCFFFSFFNITSAVCITYYKATSLWICNTSSTLFFIFLVFFPCLFSLFATEIAYDNNQLRNRWFLLCVIIYGLYLLIVILNLKTGWIFSYNPEKGYVRGSLANITYILTAFYVFQAVFVIILKRKTLARRIKIIFIMYPLISLIILIIQFYLKNKVLLSGTAAYSSLLFTYLTVQADIVDYDFVTGLLNFKKLKKKVVQKSVHGALYVVSIENLALLETHMGIESVNRLLLEIGNLFSKTFPRVSYHTTTNRFAAIAENIDEVRAKIWSVNEFFNRVNNSLEYELPFPMEVYSVATEIAPGEKVFNNISEVINSLFTKAKLDGNKNLLVCDESVLLKMERKRLIFNILKRELNLDSNMFEVWFQPIWSLKENRFTYMEALSRLRGTEIGDIPPQEFVEVAESKGLIEKLGFVAFEKVCKFIAENRGLVEAVSINFSVHQMTNPMLVQNVMDTIARFELNPSSIIMEITESIFIDNYELVLKNMNRLAAAGVKFYLDDFGTGYSNLSNVIGLPFSTIKMDRSIVLMMEENQKNVDFFVNLVSTFKDAGLKILVEGVETQNQNTLVQKAGVDFIQGFLYSRPLSPDRCLELLSRRKSTD